MQFWQNGLSLRLDAQQLARISVQYGAIALRAGLVVNDWHGATQRAEPAAIVGAEHNASLAERLDKKLQRSCIDTGAIDQEMLQEHLGVLFGLAFAFVSPAHLLEQQWKSTTSAANDDAEIGMSVERAGGDEADNG